MRGFDYRSNGCGIALFVARLFSSRRALLQGLGRVGRYGDPGYWVLDSELPEDVVDSTALQTAFDTVRRLIKSDDKKPQRKNTLHGYSAGQTQLSFTK